MLFVCVSTRASGNNKEILLSWKLSSGLFCRCHLFFAICLRCLHNQPLTFWGLVVPWLLPPASPPSRPANPFLLFDKELSSPLCRHSFLPYCCTKSLPNIHLSLFRFCPCICVYFPPHHHTFTPFLGSPTTVHGPLAPLTSPCPVPCLCSEAVCCGSTNARVRRKLRMSRSPHVLVDDQETNVALFVCFLGCTVWVELIAVLA